MAGENKYTVPIGIDAAPFFKDLTQMEASMGTLTEEAQAAAGNMQKAFNGTAASSEKLTTSIGANTDAVKLLRDQAVKAGADIANSLSGKNVNKVFSDQIDLIKKKLQTLATTTVEVSVDFDAEKIGLIESKIKEATSATAEFNTVIEFAKTQLATLEPNSSAFTTLNQQILEAESLITSLNAAIGETTPEFNREAAAITEVTTATAGLNEQEGALNEQHSQTETRVTSLRAQLRGMREELALMEIAGKRDTAEFRALSVQAGELADQIQDTGQRIRVLASDTKYLDAGISAITGLTGAFTAAQGASALFGDENEKTQKVIQKVTGALAILQGIQALANALNKDSALSVLLLSRARQADAVAAVEETIAIEGEAVATEAATVATVGFTAALLLNPITLIVAAITLAIAAFVEYASKADDATDAINRQNIALEVNKSFIDDQVQAVQDAYKLQTAQAEQAGKKQSAIQDIQIQGLRAELKARQQNRDEILKQLNDIQKLSDKEPDNVELGKQLIEVGKQYKKSLSDITDAEHAIEVKGVEQHTEVVKETVQLNAAFLQEQTANYNERRKIQGLILQSIKDARNEQSKSIIEADKRDAQKLKDSAADRLDTIKQNILDYKETIRENNAQVKQLGDEAGIGSIDPELAAKKIADLKAQNHLYTAAIKQAGKDAQAIRDGLGLDLLNHDREVAKQRLELQLAANVEFAQSEEEGNKRDQDVLKTQYEQRNQQIITQFASRKDLIGKLLAANTAAYANALIKLNYEYGLKVIDQDSQLDQLRLQNSGIFAENNKKQQEQLQIELLKIQLEYAEKKLTAMIDDGTKESEIAIAQQKQLIAKLKAQIKQSATDANNVDFFDLVGLGGINDDQKQALTQVYNAVNTGLKAITDAVVQNYQMQIDAKQKLIDSDTDALQTLQNQLDQEKALRDKGLANNVDAIEAQIAAKQKQVDDEKAQQQQLIKQRQAAQKAQANIDALEQASSLAVAAVNIFKATSSIPVVGVALGIIGVAALVAGFVAAQIKIRQSINAETSPTSQYAEGGEIEGRKHTQGGQKYRSLDGTGNVIELEAGEYVVKRSVVEQYGDFLEALNSGQLTDDDLRELLHGSGISLATEVQNKAVADIGRRNAASLHITQNQAPELSTEHLEAIRAGVEYLSERKRLEAERWEDSEYYYKKEGNTTTKTKKK